MGAENKYLGATCHALNAFPRKTKQALDWAGASERSMVPRADKQQKKEGETGKRSTDDGPDTSLGPQTRKKKVKGRAK